MHLQVSSLEQEGEIQVSKSLKHPLLIDSSEMEALFEALGSFHIFRVSGVLSLDKAEVSKMRFLETYRVYIEGLKKGKLVDEKSLRAIFSSVFTVDPEHLFALPVKEDRYLIKVKRPVIQLKLHHFVHSEMDGRFHLGVMAKDSISWGIVFSYPQLFQDPKTKEIIKVRNGFPNTALFQRLTKWTRTHTLATPMLDGKNRVNVPMRLGKKCFSWINNHPSLKQKNLEVLDVTARANT